MLQIGDKIISQSVTIQDGTQLDFPQSGQKYILFFYPKDNTPGCTAEACSIRDSYTELKSKGYELYGVSVDSAKSHIKFIEKFDLPFPLITDESKELVEYFGLWGKKKFMGREYMGTTRATYIIDEKGVVSHLIEKVDTKEAAKQLLEILG
jgi:thioredoxin-dependent peroxiredoxin